MRVSPSPSPLTPARGGVYTRTRSRRDAAARRAASARSIRAPAKSTSGAARLTSHVRGSSAGAAWPSTEDRRVANARFASPSNARTRDVAPTRLRRDSENLAGAGEEHARRRVSTACARESRGRGAAAGPTAPSQTACPARVQRRGTEPRRNA
jgi:hypothetical protein